MQSPFSQSKQVQLVSNFDELVNLPFQGEHNAMCWHRALQGDFLEIVNQLRLEEDVTEILEEDLLNLKLSEQGQLARNIILDDIKRLSECGAQPSLNLIRQYARDDEFDFISTDVYSYHVDRSPIATDTFLCTYYGAASDIVASDQVIQKIQIPEVIEQLKALYDGPTDQFHQFLEEYFFDLHYQPQPNARPINLGIGHLWRLAVDHPEQRVLPCVHRAPDEQGDIRLLLIC